MLRMSKLVNPNITDFRPPLAELQQRAEEVAQTLTLMGNGNRLLILCHLLDGEHSVGALQSQVALSQSALSQHLAKLRAAGLVSTRRDGQTIYYRIADPRARDLIGALYTIYCDPPA